MSYSLVLWVKIWQIFIPMRLELLKTHHCAVWNMKMKSIIIFIVSNLKPWSWFNFISIAERTCRDAKNLLWKIRSMTCRNVKNNWNWYFNLKSVFNSIDQIQFVILLKGNVDNAFLTWYVLSLSNVSQSFADPDFAGIEKKAETEINSLF